ncbi:DMT family transporter [Pseudomonas saliphila]|uniref:4-amino-4-deoxy-L-arabinose-phospho-UDP flippase n=1 Tax=Pseudomonas saliphila TaxID=2586906 RepID=UPI001F40EEE9|nr:4-amino-4-deoxy-L-arabinose-phospho-UDP flippase [Pseudomonas saliphila]
MLITYLMAALCVLGIAAGQILFKLSATAMVETDSLVSVKSLIPLSIAIALYGVTSLGWVWTLQRIDLGRVYPLMAMAFVLVPLGSYVAFGERFQAQYFIGVALIIAGIVVTVRA